MVSETYWRNFFQNIRKVCRYISFHHSHHLFLLFLCSLTLISWLPTSLLSCFSLIFSSQTSFPLLYAFNEGASRFGGTYQSNKKTHSPQDSPFIPHQTSFFELCWKEMSNFWWEDPILEFGFARSFVFISLYTFPSYSSHIVFHAILIHDWVTSERAKGKGKLVLSFPHMIAIHCVVARLSRTQTPHQYSNTFLLVTI